MILRRVLSAAAAVLALPGLAAAQSLFYDGAPGARLFSDHRARSVNDIVTIVIVESSSSSRSATTKSSQDTTRTSSVGTAPTFFDPVAKKLVKPITDATLGGYERPSDFVEGRFRLGLSDKGAHEGKGSIDRSDRMTGTIAARVVKVLDNGNMVIEGRRALLVNNENQIITISGMIRPQDVTGANTVLSTQIADAEVQMVGRGLLGEAQNPGWIYRLLDWLRIF